MKGVLGTAAAAMMLCRAACLPMAVFAEDVEKTNLTGVGTLPTEWKIYADAAAAAEYIVDDGGVRIKILENGGEDDGGVSRWDLQLTTQNLTLNYGDTYSVNAVFSSDADGEIYTKIGNLSGTTELWHNGYGMAGDYYEKGWACIPVKANQRIILESTWTCRQDMEKAEWSFQFGGAGDYQDKDCFPNGTTLKFSSLVLRDLTTGETLTVPLADDAFWGKSIEQVYGDVDGDANININDVILLSRFVNEDTEVNMDDNGKINADVNCDGVLDAVDTNMILQYIAHLLGITELGKNLESFTK